MTRRKVTLKNNFHNTSVKVYEGELSPETVRRVKKVLCGVKGCTCSNNLGVKGEQDCEIIPLYYNDRITVYRIEIPENQ